MKYALLILGDPAGQPACVEALGFVQAAFADGHQVRRAFFYSDAVRVALAGAHPELAGRWTDCAAQHGMELIVCSSSALRRGVLDAHEAQALDTQPTLAGGFLTAGLGLLAEAILECDQLVTIGEQQP